MSNIQNALLDNSCHDLCLVGYLRQLISSGDYNHIRIATGYWDLPGMKLLYDELERFLASGGRLDLMIGQEPQLRAYQLRSDLADDEKPFPDFYIKQDVDKLSDDYQDVARLLLDYCDIGHENDSQVQIRVYGQDTEPKAFLHAKCYIFLREGSGACGIVGSSNFTEKGLQENAELNYLETNAMIVTAVPNAYSQAKGHNYWFDEKWQQSQPWTGKFIMEILQPSPIGKKVAEKKRQDAAATAPLTPYELYIKLLHYQFGDVVDADKTQIIANYLPPQFTPLEYQMDAVKQCFNIMKTHGGFMLADVVGLGKTIVGTLIIKYFLNYPDAEHEHRVLVVTPPAIKSAWVQTVRDFDKDSNDRIEPYIDYITIGSIESLVDDDDDDADTGDFETALNYRNYGLIMVDESHKFRNSDTLMYRALDDLIARISENTGSYPYIGLLSATPQNNTPNDLKNQIYLFQRNRQYCTLDKVEGRNLEAYFARITAEFTALRQEANAIAALPEKTTENLKRLEEINIAFQRLAANVRDTVLCDVLVRRTRTDLKQYYNDDLQRQQLVFPEISGPHSLKYKMDAELAQLFADTMDMIAPSASTKDKTDDYLRYLRYRATEYLVSEADKERYSGRGSRGAEALAEQLAKIMQNLLVKRLESSFSAFTKSLLNLRNYTQNMIKMWENDTIFICPQIDVNAELDYREKEKKRGHAVSFGDCISDLRGRIQKLTDEGRNERGQNREYTRQDFKADYIVNLKQDYELISNLYDRWARNSEDPKLDEFKACLTPVLFNPETNRPQKLVIFSEAIDTVTTLKRAVENKGYKVLMITAANRDEAELTIRENFDANYKGEWKNDYQVIITTEVLAEGINLHRANVILNYDTPWNSTRLMQRIGRVNRIGSREPFVYVYNFMPSAEGDKQIQLVEKAHIKLQSFHTLFGEDAKVFTDDEQVQHYELKKFVDGEESPYEKYIYELKQYRDSHPERYEHIVSQEDDLQMAVSIRSGNSYLLVRTPRTKGLFVHIDSDGKGRIIRALDVLPAFKTDETTVRAALPTDWDGVQQSAIRTFGQHMAKVTSYKVKDKAATRAKGIIVRLSERGSISQRSQQLLDAAFVMIKKGNADIIRTVLAIGQRVFDEAGNLFPMDQQEIDDIIAKKLDSIVEEQAKRMGKPEVYIALAK